MKRIKPQRVISSMLTAAIVAGTFGAWPPLASAITEQHPLTIGDYVKSGKGSVHLVGDGHNTDHCQLVLTSAKTGKSTSTTISTVCAAKENQKAPPTADVSAQDKLRYNVATSVDPNMIGIAKAADKLSEADLYKHLLINPHNRKRAIAQLAIWQYNGEKDPEAQVTPATIRADLMKKAQLKPKDLRGDNKKVFDGAVDDMFMAVDLTRKVGLAMAVPPKKEEPQNQHPQSDYPVTADNPASPRLPVPPVALAVNREPETVDHGNDGAPPHDNGGRTTHAISIPAYTLFEPSDSHYQNMMTLDDTDVDDPDDDQPVTGGLPPGTIEVGNGPGIAVAAVPAKRKKKCAWVFRDFRTVDFGKGPAAADKIKSALEKFIEKAADWGEMATGVTDAIDKLGPQAGLCDVELIYLCVVTDPGDENVQVGDVMGERVVILSPGTDPDAQDFQKGQDGAARRLLDLPRKDLTKPENNRQYNDFMEWNKIWERHKPHGNCCCN
ncbi:MAG TPA: hypothetical protein V6D22_19075 [Candidatus Obscuribacterales bacterium]